jgi:hypothetical protein
MAEDRRPMIVTLSCHCGADVGIGCMLTRGARVDVAKATASIARGLGWTHAPEGWRCANCTAAARRRREALS